MNLWKSLRKKGSSLLAAFPIEFQYDSSLNSWKIPLSYAKSDWRSKKTPNNYHLRPIFHIADESGIIEEIYILPGILWIGEKLSEIMLKIHYCFLQDTPIMVIQLKLHNLVKVKMMSMSITMTTTIMNMRQKPRVHYPNQMFSLAPIRFWFPYRDGSKV